MTYTITSAEVVRLEHTTDGHNKWYEITYIGALRPDGTSGCYTRLRYGAIGSGGGQGVLHAGYNVGHAKENEKKRKGYREVGRDDADRYVKTRLEQLLGERFPIAAALAVPIHMSEATAPERSQPTLEAIGEAAVQLMARAASDPQAVIVEYAALQAKWAELKGRFAVVTSQVELLDDVVMEAFA